MVDKKNKSTPYSYRYIYFQKYLLYTKPDDKHTIKNNHRYEYYNKFPKYNKSAEKNTKINNTIDLSNSDIFIKGTSINPKPSSTSCSPINTPPNISTFNVLDILLPGIDKRLAFPDNKNKDDQQPVVNKLEFTKEEQDYDFEKLDLQIETIEDLIMLGKKYNDEYKQRKKRYNINIRVLADMVEPLQELSSMIGMEKVKETIFDKIILFLQDLENKNTDYQHIAIYGGPGMGKTHVSKIIGRIYAKLGILSKGDFKEIKLTDLKSGYVGQSELKTQKLLDDAKGCVVFFDEAYSLGSDDKIDSYSQGILDLINLYLDKYKNDLIMIIAGYKDDLNNRFFKGNQGLKSRFGLLLELEKYNGRQLKDIFIKNVTDYSWSIKDNDISDLFFEENKDYFKYFGRDIANLFSKCKIAHAKRIINQDNPQKKIITKEDLEKGFSIYRKELDIVNADDSYFNKEIRNFMYS